MISSQPCGCAEIISVRTSIIVPSCLCSQSKGFILGSQDPNFLKSCSGIGVGRGFAFGANLRKR